MRGLYLENFRKKVVQQENSRKQFDAMFRTLLGHSSMDANIQEYSIRQKTLCIVAHNKSIAQELFMRKPEFLAACVKANLPVDDILIK